MLFLGGVIVGAGFGYWLGKPPSHATCPRPICASEIVCDEEGNNCHVNY